jgi:LysM repeat protein
MPVDPPANPPASGETAADPLYTVQVDDTLSAVASRSGTSVEAIAQANSLDNPNLIFPGQRLTIPPPAVPGIY